MNDGNKIPDDTGLPMKLITLEELADWLKVPKSWIYDRTRTAGPERLPFYKLGRYLRFSVPEIEDYIRIRAAGLNGI
jgi:excisionase family DNA binding protein